MPVAGLFRFHGPSFCQLSPEDVQSSSIVIEPVLIIPPVLQKCRLNDTSVFITIPVVGLADFTSDKTGGMGVIVGVGQKFFKVTVEYACGLLK